MGKRPKNTSKTKCDWQTLTAKVLHCLVLRAHQKGESLYGTLLFTENCTEETRKSKQGRYCELMYTIFSTLKDFPKQIRIKRKYLEVVRR